MELLLIIIAVLLASILITLLNAWSSVTWIFLALLVVVIAVTAITLICAPLVAVSAWLERLITTADFQSFYKRWLRTPGLIAAGSIMAAAIIYVLVTFIKNDILRDPIGAVFVAGFVIGLGGCAFHTFKQVGPNKSR